MDTGIYTQKLNSGVIHNVQVRDSAGNPRPLDPATYIARGLLPPIEDLPDIADYHGQK